MTDDLMKRLREVGGMSDDGATRWYINPDGPEAASRIEKLEAALREPTLPMLLAGKKSLYSCSEDPEIEDARACFLAMARKALEGKNETIG